jgi:uncharacterized protein (TIGR03437 family)
MKYLPKQFTQGVAVCLLALLASSFCVTQGFAGQERTAEIQGPIISLPSTQGFIGDWVVAGRKVRVTAETRINQERGQVAVGAIVEATGTTASDGALVATLIEVKFRPGVGTPTNFRGAIEMLPSATNRIGDWKVGGKTIHVTQTTKLLSSSGNFAVGETVEIVGVQMNDGSISALIITLVRSGNPMNKFNGVVERLPSTTGRIGDWTVSGVTVRVTPATRLIQERGEFAVGSHVEVEGMKQNDGVFLATKIEVRANPNNLPMAVKFTGQVEMLPNTTGLIGEWKVSGRAVRVSAQTRIRPNLDAAKTGVTVEVIGTKVADGPVNALSVAVKDPDESNPNFIRFFGRIVSLPSAANFIGDWRVDDKTVKVTDKTRLNQERAPIAVGAFVEVRGLRQTDGKIEASQIEVKQGGTTGFIEFKGVIEALPAATNKIGDWTVSRRIVHVTDRTKIDEERKPVAIGVFVEVKGSLRADGSIDAIEIETKADPGTNAFISFHGTINALPAAANKLGDWRVNDRVVHVTDKTRLDQTRGQAVVGAQVHVKGTLRADGSVDAQSIEVRATTGGANPPSFIELTGKIVTLPNSARLVGEWKVDDKTVRVSGRTIIKRDNAPVVVGATVKVKGVQAGTGPIEAFYIEVLPASTTASAFAASAALTSVSASRYLENATSDSIIAAFGSNLARTITAANSLPLPTELSGVSVYVDDKAAGLFFVSPTQINYLVPAGLQPGTAMVTVELNDEVIAAGSLTISDVAPSLFTADATGRGAPAGVALRVRANGQQSFEPLARFDSGQAVPAPIVRRSGETLYLVLFGTGLRTAEESDGNPANGVAENVEVTIGGVAAPVLFAGRAPGFAGLDQLNLQLPANAPAGAQITLVVKVNDGNGNLLSSNTVTIAIQ